MKLMKTVDSIGQILCHDITQIIKGVSKDVVFKKGHVIKEEDIPILLNVGKEHIYIWELDDTLLHENDAAMQLSQLCKNTYMSASLPKEGKIELFADIDGLFIADTKRLQQLNHYSDIAVAARISGFPVKKGDKLCGMRIIPLTIKKDTMDAVKQAAGSEALFKLIPIKQKKYAIVTTGSELFHGRIQDTFTPVITEKMSEYGCHMLSQVVLDDDPQKITHAIHDMLNIGAELVFCTGGMSVDPDDKTPLAIKNTNASIISYGAPVLPGSMFLLAYTADKRPICGLPGCVMYEKRTIFDLLLPMLLADIPITKHLLSSLGNGGLCLNCNVCHYPNCMFGKGIHITAW